MANATLYVKVNSDTKKRAKKVARALRLPLSLVVNTALQKFADEGRLEVALPFVPNRRTARELRAMLADVRRGKNMSREYGSTADMLKALGL